MSTVIAALRSAFTYVVIALYVAVAGTIGLAIALPLKLKGVLYELGHYGIALALGLSGIRYRVSGRQNVPRGTAVVYCSNHQSNVDPPVLYRALDRRLHILFKAELRSVPILGIVMETGGFIPVTRGKRDEAMGAIDLAAASIRSGNSFLIFLKAPAAGTKSSCPSRRVASSWRSRRRRRSCRWRCRAAATRCGRGAPSSGR